MDLESLALLKEFNRWKLLIVKKLQMIETVSLPLTDSQLKEVAVSTSSKKKKQEESFLKENTTTLALFY